MDGTVELKIQDIDVGTLWTSPVVTIAGLPWHLEAKTRDSGNVKYLDVHVYCNPGSESTLWKCDARVVFSFGPSDNCALSHTREVAQNFNCNANSCGFPCFIECKEAVERFLTDDGIVLKAQITVQNSVRGSDEQVFDFTVASPYADGILLVEGKQIYVNKAYLALHSPVFHSMFFTDSVEKEKKEIELKDVALHEFIELLEVIYPKRKEVSAENVQYLLELGDRFDVQFVMDECEKFLVDTKLFTGEKKMVWAGKYRLTFLQDHLLQAINNRDIIKRLKETPEYKEFSDAMKVALFHRFLEI